MLEASTEPFRSAFIYTVCQVGAEPALKAEIAREHPALRFAYSRPGFVTFKLAEAREGMGPDFELRSVFSRSHGLSIGRTRDLGELLARAGELAQAAPEGKLRLHVFERDQHAPNEEPKGYEYGHWSKAWKASILAAARDSGFEGFFEGDKAREDEWVFDVVAVEEGEIWFGVHAQRPGRIPWPGGRVPLVPPTELPSRAYYKLEEAIAWTGAPVAAGDWAVEIGSAPGGASYALLRRGVNVVGIDPGEMDRRVLRYQENPGFYHIRCPVAEVTGADLPDQVDWLLLDMNVEPRIALGSADRLMFHLKQQPKGVFLTVKLNQWKLARLLPEWIAQVREMGLSKVRATQLASHRQEILIYGLTRRGLAFKSGGKGIVPK